MYFTQIIIKINRLNHNAVREKVFNAVMLTFVYGLAIASYFFGYEIYMRK